MFDPCPTPRLMAIAPGNDFAAAFVQGLRARMAGQPPHAMANVLILVNSAGMLTRLRDVLVGGGPGFLPRLRLVTAPGEDAALVPPPVPPLRRRLELAQLVRRLIEAEPDLAPRSAAFSLAERLAALMDEMQAEGVPYAVLDKLDVSDHSAHWARALRFLQLVARYLGPAAAPDMQRRQRLAVEAQIARWQAAPPAHPVLVVGSTGSRSATAMLMQAVARLPQGAVVLPGFDFDMPAAIWNRMDDPLEAEDHPQFRHAALLHALHMTPGDVTRWSDTPAPDPMRARLISLALRPAPVTDQWRAEGRELGALMQATAGLTLIEAPTPRAEALAIALALRAGAAKGQRTALVTPDRALARQVSAALDRWQIRPDDSAGRPLGLSAAGRFLRHGADTLVGPLTAEALVILLKHPITHSAINRGPHLLLTRALELFLRRRGVLYPSTDTLAAWAGDDTEKQAWAAWLAPLLTPAEPDAEASLSVWLDRHLARAAHLAQGVNGPDTGALWQEAPGEKVRALMDMLGTEAEHAGPLTLLDYRALIDRLLSAEALRDTAAAHPLVSIHGIREAREVAADLVILAGLNEGTWPAMPAPDPWLNRQMRLQAGLFLPERQIGLAAHDFQQAACAPQVMLTRARRNAEAETVPARWLNRLTNLIAGLKEQGGETALAAMRARGQQWLASVAALEADHSALPPGIATPSPRPAPAPPRRAPPRPPAVPPQNAPVSGPQTRIAPQVRWRAP
ncbi:MAG: double-strand break repair protein AddB, partial [Pararhodobacter sp.]|nr:double-strand break repair protein AddB [Pararhodobacter sp.]